jgi:hypothetical protein
MEPHKEKGKWCSLKEAKEAMFVAQEAKLLQFGKMA